MKKTKVLFVCMGNICRSPTADGYFNKIVKDSNLKDKIDIDSAGTHAYHIGEKPDPRSVAAAARRNIDLNFIRARQVIKEDFNRFDYILAMDKRNLNILLNEVAPKHHLAKVSLFLDYSKHHKGHEVPDPYYGGKDGFENVLNLIESASKGLLKEIKEKIDASS